MTTTLHTLAEAATQAKRIAEQHRVHMAIVWEREEGVLGYGWCPASAVESLYGVQIRAGIAGVEDYVGCRYAKPAQSRDALRCFPGLTR